MDRGRWICVVAGTVALIAVPVVGVLAAEAEPIDALLAEADLKKGKSQSLKCRACHDFKKNGKNKIGPPLWDVVGRTKATAEGYKYSDSLKAIGGEWTYDALNAWLFSPKDFAKGNKMKYAGMKKTEDRANMIGFLRSLADEPAPLPQVRATPAPAKQQFAQRTADVGH